jgi:cell division protein FtsI/penicillin-binding protein 2
MGSRRDPIAGADVMLSLDLGLQREADKQLKQRLAGSHADLGAAILMDSYDGSILAMASEPTFDNNLYGPPLDAGALAAAARAPGHPMLEHATQVASPPGSTFKLVVAAAGVADNAIAPYDVIPTGYWFGYGNVSFHGWGYLPPQNLPQAIAWSNDVYFYKLALALGPEKIKQVASLLGAGVPTGIDLPGEDDGLVGTPDLISQAGGVWYPGNSVILGIGQGYVTATPMQVVRWSSALATGAVATPHLGLAYRAPGGQAWNRLDFPAPAPLPFAGKLAPIREGMRQAVTNGVDPEVSNLPIPAGAKTGTAEDPSTVSGDTDSWFVTTAPYTGTDVTGLVYARGGGQGYMSGEAIRQIVADYWANRPAITATPAAG